MPIASYLNRAPLAETVDRLSREEVSLKAHVELLLERIHNLDGKIESLLPEPERKVRLASDIAGLADRYDRSSKPPLYGALVGVKDIFHVDGFVTRAGSVIPPELFAADEAECVKLLRAAGAVILGKTVTTEFAYFEPGPTRNPYNLAHTPGGSSSGSAAATAAGFCNLALGTQTIGSVLRPAAFCGIIGFKPTYERIPSAGLVYFSRTVDHVGLFTQDMDGMVLAASVLCSDWKPLSAAPLPVLGVPDGPYLAQAEPAALVMFEEALQLLTERGYEIRRVPVFSDIEALNALHRKLAYAEFAQEHAQMYVQHKDLYRPRTAEIIEFGLQVDAAEMPGLRANCMNLYESLQHKMSHFGIDLWACPPAPGPAPRGIQSTGDPNMNLPWTHAGMPAISLPTGQLLGGLPLGMQLVARRDEDEQLLCWATEIARVFEE